MPDAWKNLPIRSIPTALVAAGLLAAALGLPARADTVDTLREFAREVKTGKAEFTQTVTSPDGAKKKTSRGSFEFARPERFRFSYAKPFEQTIVSDGRKVYLHDIDLNQVSVRPASAALGATPAALLAGGELDKDFTLASQPAQDGIDWVQATPKAKDASSVQQLRVGFKGKQLAALEIVDAFGSRSLLQFSNVVTNPKLADDTFRFVPPKGADVIEQP